MENLNTFFNPGAIKFALYEQVIIDSAEVKGTVIGIRLDSMDGITEYLVSFPYGSVGVSDESDMYEPPAQTTKYDCDDAYFTANELRKC